jgi:hypothetical protein
MTVLFSDDLLLLQIAGIPLDVTVIVAIITGALGIVGTYLSAVVKFRKDLEAKYDIDLRDKRIEVYKELWKRLQPLAKYLPAMPFTYKIAQELSANLRARYFEVGGLFLSESSRDAYFTLLDKMEEVLKYPTVQPDEVLSDDIREEVRQKSSMLRTQLAKDVGTRQESRFKYD